MVHAGQWIRYHLVLPKAKSWVFWVQTAQGKTTTMAHAYRLYAPTSGTAEIGGFDVVENSLEVRKLVGYMPESVPLYNEMTLMEYLTYMGEFHNIPDLDDRVDEVLEKVHLDNRAGGYVGNLSKVCVNALVLPRPSCNALKCSFSMSHQSDWIPLRLLKFAT
jgi:ABC-type uncharacterized transport system ATPase subunit